jgi:cytochrome c-type biogenesis protein CcmE
MIRLQALYKKPDLPKSRVITTLIVIGLVPFIIYFVYYLITLNWNLLGVLQAIFTKDLLFLLTILVCLIVVGIVLIAPNKKIQIYLTDEQIVIDENKYNLRDCIAWAMVDLGSVYEIILRLRDLRAPFKYFYLPKNDQDQKKFLTELSQLLDYQEDIIKHDNVHNILRFMGLK